MVTEQPTASKMFVTILIRTQFTLWQHLVLFTILSRINRKFTEDKRSLWHRSQRLRLTKWSTTETTSFAWTFLWTAPKSLPDKLGNPPQSTFGTPRRPRKLTRSNYNKIQKVFRLLALVLVEDTLQQLTNTKNTELRFTTCNGKSNLSLSMVARAKCLTSLGQSVQMTWDSWQLDPKNLTFGTRLM